MAKDEPLKSAYELAMERLRAKDREAGVDEPTRLTAEQKKEITELRQAAKAKLAEIEIMHRKQMANAVAGAPEEIEQIEERLRVDRRRVESKLESDIALVKRGEKPGDDD
jgi:glutamate synthase domain-containing protein 1